MKLGGAQLQLPGHRARPMFQRLLDVCTWYLAAVERHGDVVNGGVARHERRVEQRAGALRHVTRHVTVVDDDLYVAAAGRARVDCAPPNNATRYTPCTEAGKFHQVLRTYVDAAYCCRPSHRVAWSVCPSVCHNRQHCKTAEPIEMPLGCGLGWT